MTIPTRDGGPPNPGASVNDSLGRERLHRTTDLPSWAVTTRHARGVRSGINKFWARYELPPEFEIEHQELVDRVAKLEAILANIIKNSHRERAA